MPSHCKEKLDTTFHKKQFYVEMEQHSYVLSSINVSGLEYIVSKSRHIIWRNRWVFIQIWVKNLKTKGRCHVHRKVRWEFQSSPGCLGSKQCSSGEAVPPLLVTVFLIRHLKRGLPPEKRQAPHGDWREAVKKKWGNSVNLFWNAGI